MAEATLIAVVALLIGFGIAALIFRKGGEEMRKTIEDLRVHVAQTEASLLAEKEKTLWTQDAKEQFKDAFKALAAIELELKSNQLKTTAKDELGGVVAPLKDELKKLDVYVRELEGKREGAYSTLGTQLNILHNLQDSLRQQTTALAQALKAPTVRGRWGEIHLRRLVELAGMNDHVDFYEQEVAESGRPDMIVRLPQGGLVPVDAKVPLDAYLEATEKEDDSSRKERLIAHAQALRSRVRELSQRAYWDQFETSPDVVVMFVPIEASLSAAFQQDRDLFEFAFQNKVLVSSPIVLFALLKTIAFGWQQQQVSENAAQIAEQGKTLYDRILTFVDHLSGMGKSLEGSVKKYNEAVGSLEGRLLPAARRLKDLGVATAEIEAAAQIESQPRQPSLTTAVNKSEDL